MGTKDCLKQPNIQQSRLLSTNLKIESVFFNIHFSIIIVGFVCFVYLFNIFHFYITSFSSLYLAHIFGKNLIQMGQLRGVFTTQSNI